MTRGEGGSVTLELVLLAPVLVLLMGFVAALGTISGALSSLDETAWQAARAAANARSQRDAEVAARLAVAGVEEGDSCTEPRVAVNLTHDVVGGSVAVEVSCVVDLAPFGLPFPVRQLHARAVAPLDPNRGWR